MALFSLQKIREVACNQQTYLRGVSCYNSGAVRGVTRARGGLYDEMMTAEVESGKSRTYRVELCFAKDGTLARFDCACPSFSPEVGACKHIVAVLVHKYYTDMVSDMRASSHRQPLPQAQTDEIARRMIARYIKHEAAQLEAQLDSPPRPVRLHPMLLVNGRALQLTFTVEGDREYVLRDLRAFARAMAENGTVSYGRSFSFFHHPGSFAEEDRPLLRFLLGQIPPSQGDGKPLRELTLSPVALDAFFSLMNGRNAECRLHGQQFTVSFERGDPSLRLSIQKGGSGSGFVLSCEEEPVILNGSRRQYVLTSGKMYGSSSSFGERTGALLDALQTGGGRLYIADEDMPSFCAGALKEVDGLIALDGDVNELAAFRCTPMEAEVYLDAPAKDTVAAKLLFCYNGQRVNAFSDEPLDGVTRDTLEEYRLSHLVRRLFDRIDEEDGRLLLEHAPDERMYRFMTDGIATLSAVASVYATDRVKGIGLAPPPQVSVGVRLESDLLDLDWQLEGIDRAELAGVLCAYREHRTYHRLADGRFLNLSDPALQGMAALTDGLSLSRASQKSGHARLPAYRALYLDRVLRDNPSLRLRRDEGFRRLIRNLSAVADNEFTPPESLANVLRNYQKTGFRWLKTMQQYGFGGILADDMGLGKTLQMISLILDAVEQGETLPSLVICPASLLFNWQQEFARFAPQIKTLVITGDAPTRAKLIATVEQYHVAITSYDLLKRDIEYYLPHRFAFHVLDEAQFIKNASTRNARAVKAIVSRHRFALTGTPVENRLSELWSIFDFLMPGFLYSYPRFRDRLERPIVRDNDKEALARLEKLVSPFILRRLKSDVLSELPPKTETVIRVPLGDEQQKLYLANAAQLRDELNEHGLSDNRIQVLSMLTLLREICCSPALCYDNYRAGSAKIDVCLELLREAIGAGHKVLLFSQFTSLLTLLHEPLDKADIPYYELRGSTKKEQRAAMVEAFNRDRTPLFLISLKAGGTGLNLTGADVVIHFDPWWNLSVQNQATDRAHRIGQQHPVQVYKLIAAHTVEEKIAAMQQRKQALADAVIGEGEDILSHMTAQQVLELLS